MTTTTTIQELQIRPHVRLVVLSEYIGFTMHIPKAEPSSIIPQQVSTATARLLCTNLPEEVTDDVLSVLFQQYVVIILLGFRTLILIMYQAPRAEIGRGYLVANTQYCRGTGENGSSCLRQFRSCDCSKNRTRWICPQKGLADVCVIHLDCTSLRQGLEQFLREGFGRGRVLACDELSVYDDVSLQLYNACQPTMSRDDNFDTYLPIFSFLIDALQFLDLVLQKEGHGLMVGINVRVHLECETWDVTVPWRPQKHPPPY